MNFKAGPMECGKHIPAVMFEFFNLCVLIADNDAIDAAQRGID